MEQYFRISEYQGYYILRADSGVRQDIFDEAGVLSTGPVIEAAVFKISEDYEIEEFDIEFDSDNSMFSAYSGNKYRMEKLCELLNKVFGDDHALQAVLEDEYVQEASRLEQSLAQINGTPEIYSKMGIDPEKTLSPEEIQDILGKLF